MKTKTSKLCRTALDQTQTSCKRLAATGLLAVMMSFSAHADDFGDVSKLVRAGQYAEALSKADAFLSRNPRDAQMRFLKGVILTEQNKSTEAIVVFTKLTEDYPTLPEPYNNLAVLHASAGQFDKARAALESAIRTNPSYATAYENLGDVHARLASQAYDKALQLDSGNSAAKSKLTLVRNLVGPPTGPSGGNNTNGTSQAKAPTPAPSAPVTIAKAPDPAPVRPAVPVPAPGPAPAPVAAAPTPTPAPTPAPAAAKPEPKMEHKAEPKPAPKPQRPVDTEDDDVLAAVNGWAKAWSGQDVKTYLAYYGPEFQAPNGQARKAWEEDRRSRIAGKGRINVRVESPQVSVSGNTATVKFRQIYTSDRLSANTRKTLAMVKHGGKWQIRQESTGS
jgi:tetratricopeptide (TPR) repeat protein